MSDTMFVSEVSPLIQDLGFRYYFSSEAAATAEELGLDLFTFYFVGRGGVLGDVEAPVVSAAFGYFKPSVVATMWDQGRATLAPRQAGREHLGCGARFGRRHLTGLDGLEALCAGLHKVHEAASSALAGLALYAGMAAEPIPDDLPARAMHLIALLREHRGSVHLAAVVAAGVDPAVAHHLRRPAAWRLFGWERSETPTVTDLDRRRLREVDATTDRLLVPAYRVLDEAERRAVSAGLAAAKARVGDDGSLPAPSGS